MSGEVEEENNLAKFQQQTNLVLAGDQTDADPDPSKNQRTSEKLFKSDTYLYFNYKLIIDKLYFGKKIKQGAKFPFPCSKNYMQRCHRNHSQKVLKSILSTDFNLEYVSLSSIFFQAVIRSDFQQNAITILR